MGTAVDFFLLQTISLSYGPGGAAESEPTKGKKGKGAKGDKEKKDDKEKAKKVMSFGKTKKKKARPSLCIAWLLRPSTPGAEVVRFELRRGCGMAVVHMT